jgi:hypothetical protein
MHILDIICKYVVLCRAHLKNSHRSQEHNERKRMEHGLISYFLYLSLHSDKSTHHALVLVSIWNGCFG